MQFLVRFIIVITLTYAFLSVFSFIPYLLGLLISILSFPITFFNNFYPVGALPYICLYWISALMLFFIIISMIDWGSAR